MKWYPQVSVTTQVPSSSQGIPHQRSAHSVLNSLHWSQRLVESPQLGMSPGPTYGSGSGSLKPLLLRCLYRTDVIRLSYCIRGTGTPDFKGTGKCNISRVLEGEKARALWLSPDDQQRNQKTVKPKMPPVPLFLSPPPCSLLLAPSRRLTGHMEEGYNQPFTLKREVMGKP